MPRSGIKILSENPGQGPLLEKNDRVRIRYDISLSQGEVIVRDCEDIFIIGDREIIAGLNYGLEGMRLGGTRTFKASPHLCYRDNPPPGIPANALLIFDIKELAEAD